MGYVILSSLSTNKAAVKHNKSLAITGRTAWCRCKFR